MLIHASPRPGAQAATLIEGEAHIVIAINAKGETHLRAYFKGGFDSSYCAMGDERLLQRELPKLLAELRGQIQSASGSIVTE